MIMTTLDESIKLIREALAAGPTPGTWWVRTLERDGVVKDCFVTAEDVQGLAYGAEILGDDEYRDGIRRKLADASLIAACNPVVMTALLARLDAAEADEYRQEIFEHIDSCCNTLGRGITALTIGWTWSRYHPHHKGITHDATYHTRR
jgi:hypothetical protein